MAIWFLFKHPTPQLIVVDTPRNPIPVSGKSFRQKNAILVSSKRMGCKHNACIVGAKIAAAAHRIKKGIINLEVSFASFLCFTIENDPEDCEGVTKHPCHRHWILEDQNRDHHSHSTFRISQDLKSQSTRVLSD